MRGNAALIQAAAKQMTWQAAAAMERATTHGQRALARQLVRAAASLAGSSGRPLGSNRRSPRQIQEIIRAVFAAHPSRAFPTKDLCDFLYPDQPTRVHIVKTSHVTGETLQIAASKKVAFRPAKEPKEAV
jgi:hypothetical protein